MNIFTRTQLIIGQDNLDILANAKVIVFGVGGVGSFCVEALARAGIGTIHIVDDDTVSITNINRQLIALHSTIGQDKVDVMKQRLLDINPNIKVITSKMFYLENNMHLLDLSEYNYIIDAIDTISSKLLLIQEAKKFNIPIISCMGTGNKLDPTKLQLADISKTSMCPLAKVMRFELKKRNIKKVKVLYSTEKPIKPDTLEVSPDAPSTSEFRNTNIRRATPGSISFVPSVAGLIIASEVVNNIIKNKII